MHRQYQDGDSAWKTHFMIKRGLFYIGILISVGFVSSAFEPYDTKTKSWLYVDDNEVYYCDYPSKYPSDYNYLSQPYTGKYFLGFKEAIAYKESRGMYKLVNSLGYLGKYQFGTSALRTLGVHNNASFLNDPELQEKAFVALLQVNKHKLKKEIDKYQGTIVGGIRITESGILAAAHLGGAGSVKKFLNSNGAKRSRDAYGTSIRHYMREFGGYQTDHIIADSMAKVK